MKVLSFVSEDVILISTKLGSTCELSFAEPGSFPLDMARVRERVAFWNRIKARVEGQGEGTLLVQKLVEVLDENQITCVTGINPYGKRSYEELQQWYESYGFEQVEPGVFVRY